MKRSTPLKNDLINYWLDDSQILPTATGDTPSPPAVAFWGFSSRALQRLSSAACVRSTWLSQPMIHRGSFAGVYPPYALNGS
jgi:hypothetical protein